MQMANIATLILKKMKLKLLFIGLVTLCLTSCMDIFETINLNTDGSGNYIIKIEMGEMASMLAAMGNNEKSSTQKKKEYKDSSFSFASTVDTMKNLSAQQKLVLRKADGKIHVDEVKGELWVEMKFPFANNGEFDLIQESMDKNNTKDFGILNKVLGGKKDDISMMNMSSDENKEQKGLPMAKTKYTLTNNSFSRKTIIPKVQEKAKEESEEDAMMKKMMAMMEMNMSFTLNLPKPSKKIDAKDAVVSDDKKQIKFKKKIGVEEITKTALFNCNIQF